MKDSNRPEGTHNYLGRLDTHLSSWVQIGSRSKVRRAENECRPSMGWLLGMWGLGLVVIWWPRVPGGRVGSSSRVTMEFGLCLQQRKRLAGVETAEAESEWVAFNSDATFEAYWTHVLVFPLQLFTLSLPQTLRRRNGWKKWWRMKISLSFLTMFYLF